jgi:hypothetical protein
VAGSVGNPCSHLWQRSRRRAPDKGAIGIPVGSAQPPAGTADVMSDHTTWTAINDLKKLRSRRPEPTGSLPRTFSPDLMCCMPSVYSEPHAPRSRFAVSALRDPMAGLSPRRPSSVRPSNQGSQEPGDPIS